MHALTIYQPYASLIMAGLKPYEFRAWKRGIPARFIGARIVIHAAKCRLPQSDLESLLNNPGHLCAGASAAKLRQVQAFVGDVINGRQALTYSAGLGTAIQGAPVHASCLRYGREPQNDAERLDLGYPLTEIEAVPASGKQGFWIWGRA
jgi:hypothetical protein